MKNQTPTPTHGVPNSFLTQFGPHVTAIRTFGCRDVLRFLGHGAPSRFRGELASNLKHRPEGICLRHRVNGNSIKVYDKQGAILRVETTIVQPEQLKVLEQISQGQYTIQGFRNRDLRTALYPGRPTAEVARRQAAAVTRRLRLLRAHGLTKKVSGTHRWLLTERGRRIGTALLAARNADVEQLTQLAA